MQSYLLKLIYGYVAYSDCGLLELRLGNVQKNAFASSEATCNWLKLMEPLLCFFNSGTAPVNSTGSCKASWTIFGIRVSKNMVVSSESMTYIQNFLVIIKFLNSIIALKCVKRYTSEKKWWRAAKFQRCAYIWLYESIASSNCWLERMLLSKASWIISHLFRQQRLPLL